MKEGAWAGTGLAGRWCFALYDAAAAEGRGSVRGMALKGDMGVSQICRTRVVRN